MSAQSGSRVRPEIGDILVVVPWEGWVDDFKARSSDELTLTKGDRVRLLERDDDFGDGWFMGKHVANGTAGLFPEVYTRPLPKNVAPAPAPVQPVAAATISTHRDSDASVMSRPQSTSHAHDTVSPAIVPVGSAVTLPLAASAMSSFMTTTASSTSFDGPSNVPSGSSTMVRSQTGSDRNMIHDTLHVINEHITDLRSPPRDSVIPDTVTDSGSEYSSHRMSYIPGEETDDEEQEGGPERVRNGGGPSVEGGDEQEEGEEAAAEAEEEEEAEDEDEEEVEEGHPKLDVGSWTPEDVAEYLFSMGVEQKHCDVFRDQEISGEVLLGMDQSSLFIKALDLGPVGRRLKTWQKIKALQEEVNGSVPPVTRGPTKSYGSDVSFEAAKRGSRTRTNTLTSSHRYGASQDGQSRITRSSFGSVSRVDAAHPVPPLSPGGYDVPVSPKAMMHSTSHHSVRSVSSRSGAKVPSIGLRTISDAVTGGERAKMAVHTNESPVKESPMLTPSRTGSSTPSVGPSFELESPGAAKSPSTAATAVSQKSRKKTKKETSAYTRGLQKISPREAIADAEYSGWMKKRSSNLMTTWKPRLFVLKGRRLAYYYSEDDDQEKGLIDISFHRVLPADNEKLTGLHATLTGVSNTPTMPHGSRMATLASAGDAGDKRDDSMFIFKLVPPRAGLSRAVNFTKPTVHYFAVPGVRQGRLWMAALMKATIDRDDTQPITTTYQQKTISLAKARQMRHRPPALMGLEEKNEEDKNAYENGRGSMGGEYGSVLYGDGSSIGSSTGCLDKVGMHAIASARPHVDSTLSNEGPAPSAKSA